MLIAADIMAVIYYHRSAVWKYIFRILPWAAAGVLIALVTGKMVNNNQFRMVMMTVVWIMLILMILNDIRNKKGSEIPESPLVASLLGLAGGFATMIGNSAGPVFTLYFLTMRLPKKEFIGTGAWLYLIINTGKLPLQAVVWKNITWNFPDARSHLNSFHSTGHLYRHPYCEAVPGKYLQVFCYRNNSAYICFAFYLTRTDSPA